MYANEAGAGLLKYVTFGLIGTRQNDPNMRKSTASPMKAKPVGAPSGMSVHVK